MVVAMIMEIETFAERLKRIREAKGMSKYRLAKLAKIPESYVYQLEAGDVANPRGDTQMLLAQALGVPVGELAGEKPRTPQQTLEDLQVSIKAYIPVFSEVSAGSGNEPIDYVALSRAKPAPESLRAYRVRGLCLEPDVVEGDTLIVDTALTPDPGDLVVVVIEGQASVKRFERDHLENNGGSYRPEDVTLHGVVVEVSRKLR